MGLLVDGAWHDRWYSTAEHGGRFVRPDAQFRGWVTADGQPDDRAPAGARLWAAAPGRYRLYVSLACPWAHRTLILRALKGLEQAIAVTVVDPLMAEQGWRFSAEHPDLPGGRQYLHQLYTQAEAGYSGRVTVPVLWDEEQGTIVNNESSEIIRMLSRAWDRWADRPALDLYPRDLRPAIDAVNPLVYDKVNNGVYRAGFATTQAAYEEAVYALFGALDHLEGLLSRQPWLAGLRLTEADLRLFTTLLRFEPVYAGHFKCNLRRLPDYPALWAFTRALYQVPAIRGTCDLRHIKEHYHRSHPTINPHGIVPVGPLLDLDAPHDRGEVRL